jgi:ABC-type ATPase involved in cell division
MSVKLVSRVETALIGKRVVSFKYLSSCEARKLGFERRPIAIAFEDDTYLIMSAETVRGSIHFSEGDGLFIVGHTNL